MFGFIILQVYFEILIQCCKITFFFSCLVIYFASGLFYADKYFLLAILKYIC